MADALRARLLKLAAEIEEWRDDDPLGYIDIVAVLDGVVPLIDDGPVPRVSVVR